MKHLIVCMALLPFGMMAAENTKDKWIKIRNEASSVVTVSLIERRGKIKFMDRWKIEPSCSQDIFIKQSSQQKSQFITFDFDGYQIQSPFTPSQRIIIREPISLVPGKPTRPLLINFDWIDSSDTNSNSNND